ncbi:MAG: sorbosone dehydrogenase family protein [Sphingomonas bacterium]|nr:sorbosone dehydrogenase family protein [Sphingomonas bacterium]
MRISPLILTALLAACGSTSTRNVAETQGPRPAIGAPQRSTLPTVNVATASGWPAGKMPAAAEGLTVNEFAGGLDHPRWLLTLSNGDVLVAESDSPGTDKTGGTIKGTIQKMLMKKAGSGKGSPNRIMLLRDADGDGVAEARSVLLDHDLYSPFGMAVIGDELFVANANALVAFPFTAGQSTIAAKPRLVTELPSGYNHHWTKSLVASPDGRFLYVGVGSNSNVGENGLEMEKGRAAIWKIDPKTGAYAIVAGGLRNPVGIDFNPSGGALWAVVNERDELGNDLVPDYLTSIKQGAFYGWPFSYYGQHVDTRPPANPAMVAKAISPDYALGPHVAALGLTFATGQTLGPSFATGAFIGEHGSWNRKPASGYQVVFVPFAGAMPTGAKPSVILDGFRVGDTAYGRPVGVQIGKDGSLLVADDVGGKVWRVSKAALPQKVASR